MHRFLNMLFDDGLFFVLFIILVIVVILYQTKTYEKNFKNIDMKLDKILKDDKTPEDDFTTLKKMIEDQDLKIKALEEKLASKGRRSSQEKAQCILFLFKKTKLAAGLLKDISMTEINLYCRYTSDHRSQILVDGLRQQR